jgi:pimeloyl-ACP methyl ester carboxylesterase
MSTNFSPLLASRASTASAVKSGTITVDSNGTELFYTDSGPPASRSYVTFFAVHGLGFDQGIFQKVQALMPTSGARFIAINRRDYPQSTPYSAAEIHVITNGTDADRTQFSTARGVELLTFVSQFILQNALPQISNDGSSGGVVLIGWSLGNPLPIAAVANIDKVPSTMQTQLAAYMRGLIMQEPAPNILGLPTPAQNWAPLIDTSFPAEDQIPMFNIWVTSYFQHGDLSTRALNQLSWVVPAVFRPPSIFNMTASQFDSIVLNGTNVVNDLLSVLNFGPQLLLNYRQSNFNTTIRKLLPKMKNSLECGDVSLAFSIAAFWDVEDDNEAAGGGFVSFDLVHGVNHFIHWDNPETARDVYLNSVGE